MDVLLYFLFGVIFAILIIPTIQGLADVVCAIFGVCISKLNVIIATHNKKIAMIQETEETNKPNIIGFESGGDGRLCD